MEKQAGGKKVSLVRTRKAGDACGCLSRDGEQAIECVAADNGLEMSSRSRREGPRLCRKDTGWDSWRPPEAPAKDKSRHRKRP